MRQKQIRIRITEAAAEQHNARGERFFDAKPHYHSTVPPHEDEYPYLYDEAGIYAADARIGSTMVTLSRSEFKIM